MKTATKRTVDSLTITSVEYRHRPSVRILASAAATKFEFVALRPGALVEVYDYPKSWHGVSRFVGYMPEIAGAKLLTMARIWEGMDRNESACCRPDA